MEKITRKRATLLGLKRFFTGEPCINGHISERYNKPGGECVECNRLSKQCAGLDRAGKGGWRDQPCGRADA
jgi:hypothetical protein